MRRNKTNEKLLRIHFSDHGQDFLFWVVRTIGDQEACPFAEVVSAGPFQSWVWKGHFVLSALKPRAKVRYSKSPNDPVMVLNYRITRVEEIKQADIQVGVIGR